MLLGGAVFAAIVIAFVIVIRRVFLVVIVIVIVIRYRYACRCRYLVASYRRISSYRIAATSSLIASHDIAPISSHLISSRPVDRYLPTYLAGPIPNNQ